MPELRSTRTPINESITSVPRRVQGKYVPAYWSWIGMRQRCRNPNAHGYQHYGGRGITVDPRWDSFDAFYADMGERPEGTSVDRINNDGNYEPGNCRWATAKEQAANQRHATGPNRRPRVNRTPRVCRSGHRYTGQPGCPECAQEVAA